jgi:hypothetical protein
MASTATRPYCAKRAELLEPSSHSTVFTKSPENAVLIRIIVWLLHARAETFAHA